MKTVVTATSLLVLMSFSCLAQHLGIAHARGAGGVTFVNQSGFGNVLYPGTGGPLAGRFPPGSQLFPNQLAATVSGAPLNGRQSRRSFDRGGFGYPVYLGGGYISGYAPDYSGPPQLDQQQQYSAPPAPPVIINQYFSPPAGPPVNEPITSPPADIYRPSTQQPAPEQSSGQKYYLLAFKDHSVYSAVAYWIEDKTLHYVTPQNTHNQVSLDLVDLDFTKKLNLNRDVPFTLPPAK
jgi:hypothetical protein